MCKVGYHIFLWILIIVCFGYAVVGITDAVPPVVEIFLNQMSVLSPVIQNWSSEFDDFVCDNNLDVQVSFDELTHEHELISIRVIMPTCQTFGYTIYGCVCGYREIADVVDFVDHMWGRWSVITDATVLVEGYKVRMCEWCAQEEYASIEKLTRNENYMGRWLIPSVSIDVGIFRQYDDEGGSIVDAWDSAALFYTLSGCTVIGDHNNQGFDAIKRVHIGDLATINHLDGNVDTYICVDVIQGHNNGDYLTDADGNKLYDIYPGKLICYTCNDNWRNITIVVFDKV